MAQNNNLNCDLCPEDSIIDDDEYFVYNECYFDKKYRKLKLSLCLDEIQEEHIDNIYRNFKADMENLHLKYRISKNNLLDFLECNCSKKDINCAKYELKEIKHFAKEKLKDYREDLNDNLSSKQKRELRKFIRNEKKKTKKILKFASVYKLPCANCCKLNTP